MQLELEIDQSLIDELGKHYETKALLLRAAARRTVKAMAEDVLSKAKASAPYNTRRRVARSAFIKHSPAPGPIMSIVGFRNPHPARVLHSRLSGPSGKPIKRSRPTTGPRFLSAPLLQAWDKFPAMMRAEARKAGFS